MHLIGIKCETNANKTRLELHNAYFLSWIRLE